MTQQIKLDQKTPMLGGHSPQEFMDRFWQKQALLITQAFENFKSPISIQELLTLQKTRDIDSRLIRRDGEDWFLENRPEELPDLSMPNWTMLLQSVDLFDEAVAKLAGLFRFIPDARFDDVMISFATDGGGVGPHFDSYDVFLLQASGQRKWRIGRQEDKRYRKGLPCRILENFQPEDTFVLNPGDMLYLPPDWGHDGVAIGNDCITISIGFRSTSRVAMLRGLLEAAVDQVNINNDLGIGTLSEPALPGFRFEGFYRDPEQKASSTPAQIPQQMITQSLDMLKTIEWNEALAARFLGCWLSDANPLADFQPAVEEIEFEDLDPGDRLVLDNKTRMLYYNGALFVNGETIDLQSDLLIRLADERQILVDEALNATEDEQSILLQFIDDGWMQVQPAD